MPQVHTFSVIDLDEKYNQSLVTGHQRAAEGRIQITIQMLVEMSCPLKTAEFGANLPPLLHDKVGREKFKPF